MAFGRVPTESLLNSLCVNAEPIARFPSARLIRVNPENPGLARELCDRGVCVHILGPMTCLGAPTPTQTPISLHVGVIRSPPPPQVDLQTSPILPDEHSEKSSHEKDYGFCSENIKLAQIPGWKIPRKLDVGV